MRERFEKIKNGCPWIEITQDNPKCIAMLGAIDDECWYKNCAVLFLLRHLTTVEKDVLRKGEN